MFSVPYQRIDDLDQPELVAKVFQAYIENKIEWDLCCRLIRCINSAYYPDLITFLNENINQQQRKIVYEQLQSSGLVKIDEYAIISQSDKKPQALMPMPFPLPPPVLQSPIGRRSPIRQDKDKARIKLVETELGKVFREIIGEIY